MRTLSTTSKLLAFVAAALGAAATLGLPWFGASPVARREARGLPTLDEPVDAFFGGVWRHFSETGGVSAYDRFTVADVAILVLVGVALAGAALAAAAGTEQAGRRLMQAASLALLGVVLFKVVQVAALDELVEARRGAVAASLCAGIMLAISGGLAQQKLRRRPPPRMTALHDPTLAHPRSVAPPGR